MLRESLRTLFWPGRGPAECPLVILYGRQGGQSDTDLFIVTPDTPPFPYCILGAVDMAMMDIQTTEGLLGLFDPIATEPVLTGEQLLGPEASLEALRARLQAQRTDPEIVRYLRRRGLEELLGAVRQAESALGSKAGCVWTLQNLSFAISYLSFARHYETHAQAATLRQLEETGGRLWPEFWRFYDRAKRDPPGAELCGWLERAINTLAPKLESGWGLEAPPA